VTSTRGPGSIVISGAARGIGRATAELFLARGWRVGMYDVDADAVAVTPDWANRLVVSRLAR
jgi:NAD(P)-dependent dehydrogenase (short-subunit alcohol dehydrogenase family)